MKGFNMNTKYALLSIVLTIALALPTFGQGDDNNKTRSDMKHQEMSWRMGKPTVDETLEGLHMKVWLMTQKQHKKMMKGMKWDEMGMNKAMMDSMTAGTHHIVLEVTDASLGKEIDNASAKVLIVSPSKYTATVDLRPMRDYLCGALTFGEKGKYSLAVSVNVGGVSKTKEFQFVAK
jgi:hypothetical protein